jgi:hypothetical protein
MLAVGDPGGDVLPNLSEAQLFYCGVGEMCNSGWWLGSALDYCKDTGLVPQSCFPYSDHNQPCKLCDGYDDDRGAWLCKNSWGTGWGEGGYFWIAYGECGIDWAMWVIDGFAVIYLLIVASRLLVGNEVQFTCGSRDRSCAGHRGWLPHGAFPVVNDLLSGGETEPPTEAGRCGR